MSLTSFFQSLIPILYIQISSEKVIIRNVRTDVSLSESPFVAIGRDIKNSDKKVIVAIGEKALQYKNQIGIEIINPFDHPRSLMGDYIIAVQLIKQLLYLFFKQKGVGTIRLFSPSVKLVLHPLGDPEGGFLAIEIKAFRELGEVLGANPVVIWQGLPLTNTQILEPHFFKINKNK